MPEIVRLTDAAAVYRASADVFAGAAADAVARSGRFSVALAGGSTPKAVYSLLATDARLRTAVPWAETHVFWGDERCVPPDHGDSNYRMAREAMLSRVPVPPGQVHRVRGEEPDPAAAAAAYERELRTSFGTDTGVPRFDLVLLGLGPDGHTASLFPSTTALSERARLVVANRVEKLGAWRITLTFPVLNAARLVLFIVSGSDKAEAVRDVLQPRTDAPALPASLVRPVDGRLLWHLDDAAARLIPSA
jgi:6-phosphogluconolactonase